VLAVDPYRRLDVSFENRLIVLGSGDFPVLLAHGNLLFKAPDDARTALRDAIDADEVVASESFAVRFGRDVGDVIWLDTVGGKAPFRIAAVYYDYSSDRGVIVMDRRTFQRHFGEQRPESLAVYLRDGADAEQVRADLLAGFGERRRLVVRTNAALRSAVLEVFDSTFAITYALEVIAIIVAMLGVAGTLLTLIVDRRRELVMLRLVGAGRAQVRRVVILEAVMIGAVSQAIGVAVGLGLSLILIDVINLQSFGWTLQFHLPVEFLLQTTALVVGTTALAGAYPAHRASTLDLTAPAGDE
jgi:putative ABC transport system permease protein